MKWLEAVAGGGPPAPVKMHMQQSKQFHSGRSNDTIILSQRDKSCLSLQMRKSRHIWTASCEVKRLIVRSVVFPILRLQAC